jgi:molybdate transport system substrate-binding protein
MARSRLRPTLGLLAAAGLLAAGCGGGDRAGDAASEPGRLKVFAAASLTAAFTELGQRFGAANPGTTVTFNFAGSQALATQLRHGAPADVFASADAANMDKVRDLVAPPQAFAGNLLQIVVEPGNPRRVRGLADLARGDLKVVLAAEEVPAGRYARQALQQAGVAVRPVSLEENVKAVVAKVGLGEADAGIVYVTDVTASGNWVEGVDIPSGHNLPVTYPIATVKASRLKGQAQAFVDLVRSADGQRVLARFGFLPPPTS